MTDNSKRGGISALTNLTVEVCIIVPDMNEKNEVPSTQEPDAQGRDQQADTGAEGSTRRRFLNRTAKKLAYAAPVVLLIHPKQAAASGGSQITQA